MYEKLHAPSARMSQLCATTAQTDADLHRFQQRDRATTDMVRHVHRYVTPSSKFICSEPQLHFRANNSNVQGFAYLSPHALDAADLQCNQGQGESPEGHRASQQNSHPAAQSAVAPLTLSVLSQPQVHWSLQHAPHQLYLLTAGTKTC